MKYSKKRVIKLAVPDNDPNGLVDRIQVSRNLTVKAVDVHVNIKHPFTGDLSVELTGPEGQKKTLHSPNRQPGKNLSKHFNGDIMSAFAGGKSKGEWSLRVVDSGAKDSGTIEDWTLHLHLANSKKTEVFIDDNETLKSVQVCHQGGKIASMTAHVDIAHSHIGDLTCTLTSPSGKSINLHNKTGGSQVNLKKKYSTDDLKAMIGETAKGKWTIEVSDSLKGDAGKLVAWGINVKTTTGAAKKKAAPKSSGKPDDLTKIEGIGPKIKQLLHEGGIPTFEALANSKPADIKKILEAAGPRYTMHDPGSWPRQSRLAADGKWKELEKLQDELDGGK